MYLYFMLGSFWGSVSFLGFKCWVVSSIYAGYCNIKYCSVSCLLHRKHVVMSECSYCSNSVCLNLCNVMQCLAVAAGDCVFLVCVLFCCVYGCVVCCCVCCVICSPLCHFALICLCDWWPTGMLEWFLSCSISSVVMILVVLYVDWMDLGVI